MRSTPNPAALIVAAVAVVLTLAVPASGAEGPRAPIVGEDVPGVATRPIPPTVGVRWRDALTRELRRGRIDEATYALERARSLFDLAQVRARYGAVARPDPRAATLVLRDLVLRLGELSATERREARAILARPTDGAADPLGDGYTVGEEPPVCSVHGCVHYVASTEDAPDPTDVDPANGVPDYIDAVSATLEHVWRREVVRFGYRPPKSDLSSTSNGGSALIDVYVTQLGDQGPYGYCTTDDPNAEPGSGYGYFDYSAYCVVDDDYAEFPPPSNGIAGLQVTMAHEFFHAVQFAYDAAEDAWFMESTATWMEDEIYDDVDDNLQYLPLGPLGRPAVPLDLNRGYHVYGAWIWPRFLAEALKDRAVIRRAWEEADAAPGGPDRYSLQAYARVIRALGGRFRWVFADFGMVNAQPAAFYREGASYPRPPDDDRFTITRRRSLVAGSKFLDHLTSRYVTFVPGRGVPTSARLRIDLDGPWRRAGTEGSVVVSFRGGRVRFLPIAIDRRGDASAIVPFRKGAVREVRLVLTNASTRRLGGCWRDADWRYSCAAYPRDDDERFRYTAELIP